MRGFTLIGADQSTGETVTLSVNRGSVGEAVTFGRTRGIDVREVRSDAGNSYRVAGESIERVGQGSSDQQGIGLVLLSAALPPVGLLAGAIRMGIGGKGAAGLIGAAIAGAACWAFVVLSL